MHGLIKFNKIRKNSKVKKGDVLLNLEAMKMEHRIVANVDGVIAMMNLKEGDQVQQGDILVEISE